MFQALRLHPASRPLHKRRGVLCVHTRRGDAVRLRWRAARPATRGVHCASCALQLGCAPPRAPAAMACRRARRSETAHFALGASNQHHGACVCCCARAGGRSLACKDTIPPPARLSSFFHGLLVCSNDGSRSLPVCCAVSGFGLWPTTAYKSTRTCRSTESMSGGSSAARLAVVRALVVAWGEILASGRDDHPQTRSSQVHNDEIEQLRA